MISGIRRADRELDVAARAVERRGESLSEANAAAEVRRQTVTEGKPPRDRWHLGFAFFSRCQRYSLLTGTLRLTADATRLREQQESLQALSVQLAKQSADLGAREAACRAAESEARAAGRGAEERMGQVIPPFLVHTFETC